MKGIHPHGNAQTALSGSALELYRLLDSLFVSWGKRSHQAEEYLFPSFIPATELNRLDYFRSFPHLVSFPAALDPAEHNLKTFSAGETMRDGAVQLTQLAPVKDVLTPAACYHFYCHFQGQALKGPLHLTTRATCFRRENHYVPLQRQWNFSMREIVCIGSAEEVNSFLTHYRERLTAFFTSIQLPIRWETATDPFFNPSKNPKYLLQKLDPVKFEMVFGEKLAIGSINMHRNYFGEAFQISRGGEDAFTGCVAFGIERWISALTDTFGEKSLERIREALAP
jgi:seryl-tRNA synthetase